ncbi:conserved hypothetical protein [Tenacibaculum sp. 190524A05c]|uniref:hypothetical protein n=1 Tax=Tenacibaculum platacis TaxID=3137852 RepID=UPI0031FB6651
METSLKIQELSTSGEMMNLISSKNQTRVLPINLFVEFVNTLISSEIELYDDSIKVSSEGKSLEFDISIQLDECQAEVNFYKNEEELEVSEELEEKVIQYLVKFHECNYSNNDFNGDYYNYFGVKPIDFV